MIERPIFLVGAERSGTTMLRLMLDHHPQIAWLNEFEYAIDRVDADGRFPETGVYAQWLAQHRIFQATGFAVDSSLGYGGLVNSFLEQRRTQAGKPIVGATVHRHFDRLLSIFPDAVFVHLVRDVRDVASSVIRMGWAGNVYTGCAHWIEAEHCWDALAERIGPDRWVQVQYEQLLRDPPGELARCFALIGVAFNEAMLDFHADTSYEPPDASASQRWKRKLSERQVALIESRCGQILRDRGYELAQPDAHGPGAFGRLVLNIQDKLARTKFRIDRYGLSLWLRALVARRLSPNGSYPRYKARMDEITKGTLQ